MNSPKTRFRVLFYDANENLRNTVHYTTWDTHLGNFVNYYFGEDRHIERADLIEPIMFGHSEVGERLYEQFRRGDDGEPRPVFQPFTDYNDHRHSRPDPFTAPAEKFEPRVCEDFVLPDPATEIQQHKSPAPSLLDVWDMDALKEATWQPQPDPEPQEPDIRDYYADFKKGLEINEEKFFAEWSHELFRMIKAQSTNYKEAKQFLEEVVKFSDNMAEERVNRQAQQLFDEEIEKKIANVMEKPFKKEKAKRHA